MRRARNRHWLRNSRQVPVVAKTHRPIDSLQIDSQTRGGPIKQKKHFQLLPDSCWIDVSRSISDSWSREARKKPGPRMVPALSWLVARINLGFQSCKVSRFQ